MKARFLIIIALLTQVVFTTAEARLVEGTILSIDREGMQLVLRLDVQGWPG